MVLFVLLIQAALALGVLAAPPSGCLQNPPPDDCKPLLKAVQDAVDGEAAHWVGNIFTEPIYQTPQNFSSYSPGDYIAFRKPTADEMKIYNTSVPPGLTVYRMSYVSTDMDEKPVPSSAFVLLPYSHQPNVSDSAPLQVIAWAHGTAGMTRLCAPSNQDDLYYEYESIFSMALQGFAVIGTDYAGQGTNTTFNYLAGPSHAADIVYSVQAARQVFPGILTKEWVVVGHSEGGLAAWATNEREAQKPTDGFLGTVSIGPALANLQIILTNLDRTHGNLGATLMYPAYTLEAISRLNNSVDVSQYFTEVGMERAALAARGCFNTALAAFSDVTFADVFHNESWLTSTFAQSWENRTAVYGNKKIAKPMLVIEGLSDNSVPPEVIDNAFRTHCDTYPDAKVILSKYPNMHHDGVAYASQLQYFGWVRYLFNGGQGPNQCEVRTMDLIDPNPPPGEDVEVRSRF